MKLLHKNQIRRQNALVNYQPSEIPQIGLANVAPLTKEELGHTYDALIDAGVDLAATRGEFIFRALMRESEILEQDLPEELTK